MRKKGLNMICIANDEAVWADSADEVSDDLVAQEEVLK